MNKLDFGLGVVICLTVLESVSLFMQMDGAGFSLIVGAIGTISGVVLTHEWHVHKKKEKK